MRVAAAACSIYPPGVPLFSPGETIRAEDVGALLRAAADGRSITGAAAFEGDFLDLFVLETADSVQTLGLCSNRITC